MIYADYDLLTAVTEDGEKYGFENKEKMYKFLVAATKEISKEKKLRPDQRPCIFKGITK